MQLKPLALRWLFACGVGLGLLCSPSPLCADHTSGTWTGSIDLPRGNYYWERSTRVVAPAVRGQLDAPSGIRLEGGYLVDAITSASLATGVSTDIAFTEIRHDAHLGMGYTADFGPHQLDVSVRARRSKEPDYLSRGAGFSAALSLAQHNHILRLNGYYLNDDVGRVMRGAQADSPDRLVSTRRVHRGTLQAVSLGVGYERPLSPTMLLTVGFDLAYLSGFQANAYRLVVPAGGGVPSMETHPDKRTRTAAYAVLKKRLPGPGTTLSAAYRFYRDSWDILSHSPDVRIYQDLSEAFVLRLRYRFYHQGASFFYEPDGPSGDAVYRTADPKMSAFRNHTLGLTLLTRFSHLADSHLSWLSEARLDFGIAYLLNTNRFGDGIMGQAGLYFPF